MKDHNTEPNAAPDVESDPALDDREGSDWGDEGGAAPSGPATSTSADDDESEDVVGPQITLDPPD